MPSPSVGRTDPASDDRVIKAIAKRGMHAQLEIRKRRIPKCIFVTVAHPTVIHRPRPSARPETGAVQEKKKTRRGHATGKWSRSRAIRILQAVP